MGFDMEHDVFLQEVLAQLTATRKMNEQLTEQLRKKDAEIERLNQILLNMQRARFGQSSEKRAYVLDDGTQQLSMFEILPEEAQPQAVPEEKEIPRETVVTAHTRKKKRTLEEFCANLPVEEYVSELPEEERISPDGHPLLCIGKEYVRTELVMERAKAKVVKHYRSVYADPIHEQETGFAYIQKSAAPVPLLPHSYASASVVTDVLVKKYADGLPLYRQEQIWKRIGVALGRGTLANWVIRTAEMYFRPFRDKMRELLLTQKVIHADETVLQVLKEQDKAATADSRMWVYASSKRAPIQIRCFDYRDSRSGKCAEEYLHGYRGIVVSDGYSGYNKLTGVTRAGCWAHDRRKWYEAMPKGATPENSVAARGYEYCSRLFVLEQEMENLSDEERKERRAVVSRPLLDEYHKWLTGVDRPNGKLRDAVNYTLNQWDYLCCFVDHGEVEISNNQVENAIRPFVVGRKGWLFSDTPEGAEATAIHFSLMETAKANGLNVENYLLHLLTVLPERFAENKSPQLDDLLPWSLEMKEAFSLI